MDTRRRGKGRCSLPPGKKYVGAFYPCGVFSLWKMFRFVPTCTNFWGAHAFDARVVPSIGLPLRNLREIARLNLSILYRITCSYNVEKINKMERC